MVEKKKLISVADVQYGYPFESSLFSEDDNYMPLIRIRDVKPGIPSTYYSGEYPSEYIIRKGDILVGMDGEFNLAKWKSRDGLLNQRVLKLSGKNDICNSGYLYHYMGPVFKKIESQTAGGSVKHLSAKIINSIQIPVPSLSEQNRIVGILDTFTSSIDNLKIQIMQRRKQFEHYRNKLLSFKEGEAEWMFISDIADNYTGLTYKPANVSESGTLVLRSSNIQSSHLCFEDNVYVSGLQIPQRALVKQDDVLICVRNGSRALIGKCAMIDKASEGMAFGAFMSILRAKNVNPKYLYYVWQLDSTVKQYKGDDAAPINQITSKDFSKIKVQVPILDRQRTIVQILDTFEESIKNLEAQLDLRQKQYEYYRNKLLTFE